MIVRLRGVLPCLLGAAFGVAAMAPTMARAVESGGHAAAVDPRIKVS